MKRIIFGLATLCGSTAALPAEEPQTVSRNAAAQKTFTYEGHISGVVCAACSSTVKEALLSLKGVKDVRITVSNDGHLPSLKITSTSSDLSLETAMKALGSAASDYQIQDLQKTTLPQ